MDRRYINYLLLLISFLLFACDEEGDKVNIQQDLLKIDSLTKADISFLHISDTHGSLVSISPMVDILNNSECDFGIITGDILPDEKMMDIINQSTKPVFLVPGNHDAYDRYGQYGFRNNVINNNTTTTNVVYGDENVNYYYYDILKKNRHFRIIGIDQFELDAVGRAGLYEVVMSQKQIDWFIKVLENSYSVDAFIILIHEGFGNSRIGSRDIHNVNKFVSSLAADYYNSYDFNGKANPFLIPDILHAYITGDNISNQTYSSGIDSVPLYVTTNFSGTHYNFVAYYGGHLHWDEVEYLNTHKEQLLSLIAYGGSGMGSRWNDLIKTNSGSDSYVINYNRIDIKEKKLLIFRLGAKNTQTGLVRDSIIFNF